MWHQKWACHASPIFGTYGGHFCGRSETGFNGIGGPKLRFPKHKLRPKIGANFGVPLLIPFAYRVMLFQNTLIQRAGFKHGRPT